MRWGLHSFSASGEAPKAAKSAPFRNIEELATQGKVEAFAESLAGLIETSPANTPLLETLEAISQRKSTPREIKDVCLVALSRIVSPSPEPYWKQLGVPDPSEWAAHRKKAHNPYITHDIVANRMRDAVYQREEDDPAYKDSGQSALDLALGLASARSQDQLAFGEQKALREVLSPKDALKRLARPFKLFDPQVVSYLQRSSSLRGASCRLSFRTVGSLSLSTGSPSTARQALSCSLCRRRRWRGSQASSSGRSILSFRGRQQRRLLPRTPSASARRPRRRAASRAKCKREYRS